MQKLFFIALGAAYVALIILVSRFVSRGIARFIPGMRENFIYALTLVATSYQYVWWAQSAAGANELNVEIAGVSIFTVFALVGVRRPSVLALGWLLHAGWDWAFHPMPDTRWVPFWFPAMCVGFDLVLATYIASRATREVPSDAFLRSQVWLRR